MKKKTPVPVKSDSRTCFGIEFFLTEEDAAQYARMIRRRGDTYNGGFFDGKPCGREKQFDHDDKTLGRLYAVTVR